MCHYILAARCPWLLLTISFSSAVELGIRYPPLTLFLMEKMLRDHNASIRAACQVVHEVVGWVCEATARPLS